MDNISVKEESTTYRRIADGQELIAADADHYLSIQGVMCKVLRHMVRTEVRYLVEFSNGERRWVDANEDC